MLDNFFKGDIPSIFETTIKRDKGKSADNSTTSKLKDYRNEEEFLKSVHSYNMLLRLVLDLWNGGCCYWADVAGTRLCNEPPG